MPGTRESLFYDPATTNPAMLALDAADKDTTTAAGLTDSVALLAQPAADQPSLQINVPVLVGTGHDLALSTTAPITDAVMIGWSLSVTAAGC